MERPSDFLVFADESGDHSLGRINPDYPVFVLSYVCSTARSMWSEFVLTCSGSR